MRKLGRKRRDFDFSRESVDNIADAKEWFLLRYFGESKLQELLKKPNAEALCLGCGSGHAEMFFLVDIDFKGKVVLNDHLPDRMKAGARGGGFDQNQLSTIGIEVAFQGIDWFEIFKEYKENPHKVKPIIITAFGIIPFIKEGDPVRFFNDLADILDPDGFIYLMGQGMQVPSSAPLKNIAEYYNQILVHPDWEADEANDESYPI